MRFSPPFLSPAFSELTDNHEGPAAHSCSAKQVQCSPRCPLQPARPPLSSSSLVALPAGGALPGQHGAALPWARDPLPSGTAAPPPPAPLLPPPRRAACTRPLSRVHSPRRSSAPTPGTCRSAGRTAGGCILQLGAAAAPSSPCLASLPQEGGGGGEGGELPFADIPKPEYGEGERPQEQTAPEPDNPLPELPPNHPDEARRGGGSRGGTACPLSRSGTSRLVLVEP